MINADAAYDAETYPNFFCCGFRFIGDTPGIGYIFEISERRNDTSALVSFLTRCSRLIGFNNMAFDWPLIQWVIDQHAAGLPLTAELIYQKAVELVSTSWGGKNENIIWRPRIPQIDLFRMHHLDRFGVSLKQCEFNMRSRHVEELPFPIGTVLTHPQMDIVLRYNAHDIVETEAMFIRSKGDIAFRETLGPEWVNYNNGAIGKKFFENELKAAGVELFEWRDGRRRPKQTRHYDGVHLGSVILPFIGFTRPELQAKLAYIKSQVIAEDKTKGSFKTIFDLDRFEIAVRLGGIHGSVERAAIRVEDGTIEDIDVISYYPSIAIEHGIYPRHLGRIFCDIYGRLRERRLAIKDKKASDRRTLKYALNVPVGDSNSPHGIFYDASYFLAITLNGQLMLCMLAEQFANIPGVRLIQVNTDGVTIQFSERLRPYVEQALEWWRSITKFTLERNLYRRMFVRDANNYIAEYVNGDRKRVGAYEYDKHDEKFWTQDHSELIVAKAAEAALLDDCDPVDFILNHDDGYDFMAFDKGKMETHEGRPLPGKIRYYVSQNGHGLVKVYAPLAGKTEPRRIGVKAKGLAEAVGSRRAYRCSICGETFQKKSDFHAHNKAEHSWRVTIANEFDGRVPENIDFRYYIEETQKLLVD